VTQVITWERDAGGQMWWCGGAEEEALQEEAVALAGEFREVRKLRRLLAIARQEAQQAMTAKAGETTSGAESACAQCRHLQQELASLQVVTLVPFQRSIPIHYLSYCPRYDILSLW